MEAENSNGRLFTRDQAPDFLFNLEHMSLTILMCTIFSLLY
jgi:hypothetical protein